MKKGERKTASLNPGWSGRRIFLSRVNFLCWPLFGVRPTPVSPQWHVKDPGHSATSAGDRLHLHTHTLLTQWRWTGLTVLSRYSVGTRKGKRAQTQFARECSATVVSARWATVDWPWWNWCARADIRLKKKKSEGVKIKSSTLLQKSSHTRKSTLHHHPLI